MRKKPGAGPAPGGHVSWQMDSPNRHSNRATIQARVGAGVAHHRNRYEGTRRELAGPKDVTLAGVASRTTGTITPGAGVGSHDVNYRYRCAKHVNSRIYDKARYPKMHYQHCFVDPNDRVMR